VYQVFRQEVIRDKGSISSTFYEKILPLQIQKAQKKTVNLLVFFCALGISTQKKVACRIADEIDPRLIHFYSLFRVSTLKDQQVVPVRARCQLSWTFLPNIVAQLLTGWKNPVTNFFCG